MSLESGTVRSSEPSETSRAPETTDPAAERLFAFFERLKTMSSIQRFGTLPMIQGENVASHSFNVAILALLTADYENNPAINTEKVLRQALLHDFEETILSDIPHPIKHRFQGGKLGKVLKDIVPDLVRDEIFKELPQPLRDRCTQAALTAKDGIEGRIVAAADAMDILMTSLRELKMGNRYFQSIFDVGLKLLERHGEFRFAQLFMESARQYRDRDYHAEAQPTFSDEFVDPVNGMM
jgi:5'-deoxynucleotidase YfbR-like HD superfamily hydrolase